MSAGQVEVVCERVCSTVGESPHWDYSSQSLIYVDIRAGDVHRWNSLTKQDESIHLDGHVGFALPCESGGYLAGLGPTLTLLQDWSSDGPETKLAEVDAFRFNDGKCDATGRLWTGSLGSEPSQRALYSLETTRTLERRVGDVQMPNGMAWHSSGHTMFFVDTAPRHIYAFDFEPTTGNISNQKILVNFDKLGTESDIGKPDGLCVDIYDNLWVACFGAGLVLQIDSCTGKLLRKVEFFGAKQITSCCFGGEGYADLYVTSARSRLTDEEEKGQPLAGSVFKVMGLGVKGIAPAVYGSP